MLHQDIYLNVTSALIVLENAMCFASNVLTECSSLRDTNFLSGLCVLQIHSYLFKLKVSIMPYLNPFQGCLKMHSVSPSESF